jgi:hypothetical protein
MRRVAAFVGSLAFLLAVTWLYVRPWYLGWGATDDERRWPMTSDSIVPNAAVSETRVITIHMPAVDVWPWLAQLGQDRGGFYSFDLLENLVGCEMPTEDVRRPERQQWTIGDRLWMYPANKAGGAGFATLRVYEPGRVLGFGTRQFGTSLNEPENGSWSFELVPIGASSTRLFVRGRGAPHRSLWGKVFDHAIFEPMHFVMEKRMLLGLRDVAEGHTRRRLENHVHIALWTLTLLTMALAFLAGMRRAKIAGAVLAFTVAGGVFQILTLGQPPIAIGAALTVVPMMMLWWTRPLRA